MKKIWIYLLGVLTGIIISVICSVIIVVINNNKSGLTFFEQPGDIVELSSVEVFQSLGNGTALAKCKGDGEYFHSGPNVLLYNEDDVPYYDEQVVIAPAGKCFKQVGIYQYHAKIGIDKTVPIVMLLDK